MQPIDSTSLFMRGLRFFRDMPNGSQWPFISAARIRRYAGKQIIFLWGDDADRVFVVLGGRVRLYHETKSGDEVILAHYSHGEIFGEAAVFENAGYPFSAEAEGDTQLLEIPSGVLRRQARCNEEPMTDILSALSRTMRKLSLRSALLACMPPAQRVGSLLLHLSAGARGPEGSFTFPYDATFAASKLGLEPAVYSRALLRLKPAGVTVDGGKVTILDFSALRDFCEAPGSDRRPGDTADRGIMMNG